MRWIATAFWSKYFDNSHKHKMSNNKSKLRLSDLVTGTYMCTSGVLDDNDNTYTYMMQLVAGILL
jgi:hypothetical protein